MSNQLKAYIFALLAVSLWSTVATAFKIALNYVDVFQLLLYSSFTAFLFYFIYLLSIGKLANSFKISKKEYFNSAMRGLLNPFLYYVVLFKAYDILPAQEAMTLNYVWPLMIVVFSAIFLKQKLKLKSVIAIIISFSGVVYIASSGDISGMGFSNLYGDLLAIGSSLIWAAFWIMNIKSKTNESQKLFLSFGFGFVFSLILCLIFSNPIVTELKSLISMIYIGFAEMGITILLWLIALKLSSRTDKVSQLIYLSPVLSLIWISIFLDEKIQFYTIIGLALIISGIALEKINLRQRLK
jgi:drug/metabolite transporter (DMT)-like permease